MTEGQAALPLFPIAIGLYVIVTFSALFWWFSRRRPRSPMRETVAIFLLALAVRLLAVVVVHVWLRTSTGTPFLFGTLGDDYRYHASAVDLARRWTVEGYHLPAMLYTRGFETLIATLYWLTLPNIWVGLLANVVFGALVPVVTYRLMCEFDDSGSAWVAAVLTALFPSLVFWSTLLYKDMALTLLMLLVVLWGLRVIRLKRSWPLAAAATAIGMVMVATIRIQSVLLVAGSLATAALVFRSGSRQRLLTTLGRFVLVIAAVGLVVAIFRDAALSGHGPDFSWYLGLNRIDLFYEARRLAFHTRSNFVEQAFLSLPVQFLGSFFLPLPLFVQVGSPWEATEQALLAGTVVWLWILYYGMLTVVRMRVREWWSWLPVAFMVVGTGVAIAVRGYAMIYRHKVQMYPFVIILASIGIARARSGRWADPAHWRWAYGATLLVLIVVYNYLRVGLSSR